MKLSRLVFGFLLSLAASNAFAAQAQPINSSAATFPPFDAKTTMTSTATATDSPSRLTTLDVMGIGLSVEMFRQSQVWQEMQKHPDGSILPSDLSTYPTNFSVKELASDKRSADVLEWGANNFVEHWPIPSVTVWPYCKKQEEPNIFSDGKTNLDYFGERVNDLRMPAGMHHHRIASLGAIFLNDPEEVLERAFRFFESNPEMPALILYAVDGDMTRLLVGDVSRRPYWEEGPRRFDSMSEAMVVLVLARRERVDALRPFVPKDDRGSEFYTMVDRQLSAARAAARAAGKPEPTDLVFQPSRFLPIPWTGEQIARFDHLPTIAVVHRPVRVTYRKDKNGKPTFDAAQQTSLMHERELQAAFQVGFDTALQDIPGGVPARIFYDTAGPATGRHVVPLSLAAYHSLPAFDLFKPDQGYNLDTRLGNTGAASPFVQWALAAIAAYRKKDASITVNLRQSTEATITVITPNTDPRTQRTGEPIDFKLAPLDGGPAVPIAASM